MENNYLNVSISCPLCGKQIPEKDLLNLLNSIQIQCPFCKKLFDPASDKKLKNIAEILLALSEP